MEKAVMLSRRRAVRAPAWTLTYSGVNITADISAMVLSVTYVDHLGGYSGESQVELDDTDGLWRGKWYPVQGDLVDLAIGYADGDLLLCGSFQVDELEASGAPDKMSLRCLAAFITPAMRTVNTRGYESQSILAIAGAIAAKYQLTLVGAPSNLGAVYARVTQCQETDLGFLHRLAREHNYDFTVRGTQMVYARAALEGAPPVITIGRSGSPLTRWQFKSRTRQIYRAAQVNYQDPATKALISQTATAISPTGDTLKLARRVENGQQASIRAAAALHEANRLYVTGSLTLEGEPVYVAGNNVALAGFGAFDGTYLIETARHHLTREEGYIVDLDVRSVSR
jgi:phage protein D